MSYIAKNGRLYTSGASEALTLLDDKFSVNKSYSKGDGCIYNDYLWKFTSDKPAGEWDSSVVEQCRIMDFVDDVNGRLTQTTDSIQSQIVPTASIESGETASKAYNQGDFLVKDGILYKVTNAIVKDDALTVGTNIVPTTVGGELSEIKSNSTNKWTFKKFTSTNNNVTVPSGVKEFYLTGVNMYSNALNSITFPVEVFNFSEISKFYCYIDGSTYVNISKTSTENVYAVAISSFAFAILGYR